MEEQVSKELICLSLELSKSLAKFDSTGKVHLLNKLLLKCESDLRSIFNNTDGLKEEKPQLKCLTD